METNMKIVRPFPGSRKIAIGALDGQTVITEARNTFKSLVDCDFSEFGLEAKSEPTKETNILIYQVTVESTFIQIFTSINENLDKIVLTMSQIIDFCHENPGLITRERYGLFFLTSKKRKRNFLKKILDFLLFHGADKQYFVVRAYPGTEGLGVTVYRLLFKDGAIWPLDKNLLVVCPETVSQN